MIRTVNIGEHLSIQGAFVRDLPNGRVLVRVGKSTFAGKPVGTKAA
ncbi:MAG: hypothetical protein ACU0BS_08250 [Hasllibacter sp.]